MNKQHTATSKYMSYVLRHCPQDANIVLDPNGWVTINELIAGAYKSGVTIGRDELFDVVANCDKQRFQLNDDKTHIRAKHGHSVNIDLNLPESTPPAILYHGTSQDKTNILYEEGIKKMNRTHVHLSAAITVARSVGSRHGKPSVLGVDSFAMHKDGHKFYLSNEGIWITDFVPPKYIFPYTL